MQIDGETLRAVLVTGSGDLLELHPGRTIVARVLTTDPTGTAMLSVAGQVLEIRTTVPLQAGQTLQLEVTANDGKHVALTPQSPAPSTPTAAVTQTSAAEDGLQGSRLEPAGLIKLAMQALARIGSPAAPAQVTAIATALATPSPQPSPDPTVVTSTSPAITPELHQRATTLAHLASRGIALEPAAVERVEAALTNAGQLTAKLERLAEHVPRLERAIAELGPSNAAAVRAIAGSCLDPVEVAVAHISQAPASPAQRATPAHPAVVAAAVTVLETAAKLLPAGVDSEVLQSALATLHSSADSSPRSTPQTHGAVMHQLARVLSEIPAPTAQALPVPAQAALREAMVKLGIQLQELADRPTSSLVELLRRTAATDVRPAVAEQATQLLHAMEGSSLLSTSQPSSNNGVVYFHLPIPGWNDAQVAIRRNAGGRDVSFEQFEIAFLLNTENLGNLHIHLAAQPSCIHANIRTDDPAAEDYLNEQVEQLLDPLTLQAQRPVVTSVGVISQPSDTVLLEVAPYESSGGRTYYA